MKILTSIPPATAGPAMNHPRDDRSMLLLERAMALTALAAAALLAVAR